MPKYVMAYLGGKQAANPQDRAAHMAKWKAWVAGLGSAMVDPGTPLRANSSARTACPSAGRTA